MAHKPIDTQPIAYRDQPYTAAKHFTRGTHRTCSPAETLARAEPSFSTIGLTRLADITGLDRIGVPVALATFPNSGYLAAAIGKGYTLTAAKVSAVMEAIERYHGEKANLPEIYLSYSEVVNAGYNVAPIADFPFVKNNVFSVHRPTRWVMGWDIANQQEAAAPAILVFMRRFEWPLSELGSFQSTSNGLASGNHLLEAITSGLLEVIERDATTAWELAISAFFTNIPLPKVRLETIEYPTVREVLAQFEAAQVQPILFDCTVDTQVPTYMAWLYDREPHGLGSYKGYGAHLDPEIAMLRALTEAVQARLVFIAGVRDDAFRHTRSLLKKGDTTARSLVLDEIPAIVDARERTSEATATFEGDIRVLIEKLRRAGLEQVIVYDLTLPGFDLSVVRVIVPGLEGYKGMNFFKPGHRATSFLRKAAEGIRETS